MKARVSISEIWPRHINGDDGGNARSHLLLKRNPLEDFLVRNSSDVGFSGESKFFRVVAEGNPTRTVWVALFLEESVRKRDRPSFWAQHRTIVSSIAVEVTYDRMALITPVDAVGV